MNSTHTEQSVLIVGGGPTGLLLAGDLARAGIRTTVLERRPEKQSNLSRAFVLHARTLEALDARGLADPLVEAGHALPVLNVFRGLEFDFSDLPSRFPFALVLAQPETEKRLRARALDAGAAFEYDTEVSGLVQDDSGVTVELADGTTRRAAYLVGADGHRSAVRAALGLPFPGITAVRSIMLADVRLAEPPKEPLLGMAKGQAMVIVGDFGDGWHRVMAWDKGDDRPVHEPVELETVRELLLRTHGTDYGMHDQRWLSRFQSDERQVPEYRVGRVLLAGDAAHVHTPAGGQGMNTGLQDAANLGWKLAAVLHGTADDALLDTYHGERKPVGKAVLRSSGMMMRFGMAVSLPRRAARKAAFTALSVVRPAKRRVRDGLSGLGVAYPAPRGAHRLVGRRVPDVRLAGGPKEPERLYEALREQRFVLLAPAGTAPVDGALTAHWANTARRDAVLVRPDGYAAWAGAAADAEGIRGALQEWGAVRG